jgi:glutamate carboxypeptidase
MTDLTTHFNAQQDAMLALLRELVEIESPSHEKAAVDRMADRVAAEMQACGGEVSRLPGKKTGDMVVGRWGSPSPTAPILILCHMDTVYPLGTLAMRPPRIEAERFYAPGALDMKSGIVIALAALDGLRELGLPLAGPVTLLCTADEETGSHASRQTIEALAQESRLVLCLEASLPGGVLKTARKGVGGFTVRVEGRAAHAGANHQNGVNAIAEMAQHILRLQALTDYERGTTVNVGVIQGGTASNVVPESCKVEVDFRVASLAEAERLLQIAAALQPHHPEAKVSAHGNLNRPPMERDARMIATFHKAQAIAARHGLDLKEGSTGGGSDGSYTAALGVPTLDGLGADGDGGHAAHEHILIASLAERARLIAAILSEW